MMAAAAAAMHFGARHAERRVLGFADGIVERLPEARPAGAALVFGVRGEQRQVAAGAGEDALALFLQQRARTRPLGAVLAQDLILLRRQLRAPFGVGLFDLEFLGGLRRRRRAASGRRQGQTGRRRMRAGYGGRSWKSPCEAGVTVRHQIRPTARRSYTDPSRILSLSCEGTAEPSRSSWRRRRPRRLRDAPGAAPAGGRRRGGAGCRPAGWPPPGAPRARVPGRARLRGNGPARRPRRNCPGPTCRSDGRRRGRSAPPAQTSSNGENSRQRSSPHRMLRAISCPAIAEVFSPWRPKPLATHSPLRSWPICGMPCTVTPTAPPNTSEIATLPSRGKDGGDAALQ